MTAAERVPVAIVGAGTAGLVAALSLARLGRASTIFEQAPHLDEIGAGLQLSPNALRVLERLGVLQAIESRSVAADAVRLCDGRTGRQLAEVPVRSGAGPGYLSLRRADLQAVLLDAVRREPRIELRLGRSLTGCRETADGMLAEFGDGSRVECNLLIAADGVHSAVARSFGLSPARPTGTTALRYAVPPEAMPTAPRTGIQAWLGPSRHAVFYPVKGTDPGNLVLVVRNRNAASDATDLFAGWNEELRHLIAVGSFLGSWPVLEVPGGSRPNRDRVVFVGDASHAMAPYAAQGAAMAIEDGFVLAHHISSKPNRAQAIEAYTDAREERLGRVRRRVAFHRFAYHLPRPASLARDAVMALSPPHRLRNGLAWLYDWMPPNDEDSLPSS